MSLCLKTMLSVPQIESLRYDNPYLYEALKRIVAAVNSLGTRLNVDPQPAAQATPGLHLPPPAPPASLTVTGARGIFSVALAAGAGNTSPISYFVEAASDTAFATAVVYPLGGSLVANLALGNVTRYWRARAKYIESDYSPYAYWGTQANPAAVTGGVAGSNDITYNPPSNTGNFATVDSMDAGSSATIRIYGTGGVGSSWTQNYGAGTRTFPAGTITGQAYTTTYYVMYDTVAGAYRAFAAYASAVSDSYVFVGKLTTVAAGGGGGVSGGGGGGGLPGGCVLKGTEIIPLGDEALQEEAPERNWLCLVLENDVELVATPDHPVITERGKVALKHLERGDLVVTVAGSIRVAQIFRDERLGTKVIVRMPKGHLYWANGILSHNLKPL